MKRIERWSSVAAAGFGILWSTGTGLAAAEPVLWELARQHQEIHRYSTLFTAQDVKNHLGGEERFAAALEWCKQTGVTKVYLETFRDGYQAEADTLRQARDRFRDAGFVVSGCVTTTGLGKRSSGWTVVSCYTDLPTQAQLQGIFEYAAGLFDEIMIDDFWFTDCTCPACERARRSRTVTIGTQTYPVGDDTWEAYRGELMVHLSRDRVLAAAKKVNPKAALIIKYPQWYDRFHERGYDVARETADFDRIWVGTETRDYRNQRWGGTPQYEAYFIMRWLGGIGGSKCGGGWFDWLGTTERTYVEQARQTILGGAAESMLFCYGGLQRDTGPANVRALRQEIPELLQVAAQVHRRLPLGVAAYKPANSHADDEARVFDFVGMLGLPLVPCHQFPTNAPAAFFSVHALKDPGFARELNQFLAAGKPVLLTDGLVRRLGDEVKLDRPEVHILPVKGDPKSLLDLPPAEIDAGRAPLLKSLGKTFSAPAGVALYLFGDGSAVVENFNDEEANVRLNDQVITVPARGWHQQWR